MPDKIARLGALLWDILQANPDGLSEYELMKALRLHGEAQFETASFRNSLSLFRAHFLLFHSLYRLRQDLWRGQRAHLEISALNIRVLPFRQTYSTELSAHDPLRDYYMDLSNLEETSAADVEALLEAFWSRLCCNDQRREALDVMGLEDPVDDKAIKQRYRKLVMQHHPDRGGSKERLQDIHGAMAILTGGKRRR